MASIIPKKIALITSSTRPTRIGPIVTDFVHKILKTSPVSQAPEISIIDVADFNLPLLNERVMPATVPAHAQFEYEHSKKWSAAIAPFDGYIFTSAEHNFGPPAAAKNAIDYLYNEWIGKPIVILTYGAQGGATASDAYQKTFAGMKLRVVETRPQLKFAGGMEEIMMAGSGVLGPQSLKNFEETGPEPILKAYEELIDLIEAVPEPVKAA